MTVRNLLEVSGLCKTFGRGSRAVKAVDDVSFCIREGSTLGILGESGSGKSTLARCVLRLVEPDAGKIRFADEDVTWLTPGSEASASIMLDDALPRRAVASRTVMGEGVSPSLLSPVSPVTTTSFSFRWRKKTSVVSSCACADMPAHSMPAIKSIFLIGLVRFLYIIPDISFDTRFRPPSERSHTRSTENGGRSPRREYRYSGAKRLLSRSDYTVRVFFSRDLGTLLNGGEPYCGKELTQKTFVSMRHTVQVTVRHILLAPGAHSSVLMDADGSIMPVEKDDHQCRQENRQQQDSRYFTPQPHNRRQIYIFLPKPQNPTSHYPYK